MCPADGIVDSTVTVRCCVILCLYGCVRDVQPYTYTAIAVSTSASALRVYIITITPNSLGSFVPAPARMMLEKNDGES